MKSRHVSLIIILMLTSIISISSVYALTSIDMPQTVKFNENITIKINPDTKGIYKEVYFAKDDSVINKITLSGCSKDVCSDKQTLYYKIPSDWKGIYGFLTYDYKKGEWLRQNFTVTTCGNSICEQSETAKTCSDDCAGNAGTATGAEKAKTAGIDIICKKIKFQNKSTIDNSTLLLCERQKQELKKALGKGRMKKPNGIDVKESRIIEKQGAGTIRFKDAFDVDSEDADEASGNANIYIENGIVAINTDEVPELEQPATITLYNLSFESTPAIYYNEGFTTKLSEISKPCPSYVCSNINYDNATGTLTFDVSSFSSYAAFAWSVRYDPYAPGACSIDVDCKPTAFCAKYLDCDAATYPEQCAKSSYSYYGSNDLSLCGIPEFEQTCSYKPSAGTENLTCSLFTRYSKPCSLNLGNYCEEGFTYKKIQGGSYGDSWCMDTCEKAETCNTCEGTIACEKNYCASNSFMSCLSSNCPQNPSSCWAWADCMKQASESCLTSNVNFNPPESHWCQPKVCQSPTGKLGKCFYSEITPGNITINYSLSIGDSACSSRNIKVCNNQNTDPCGEMQQTTIGCNAERNDTEKKCYDKTGIKQDYCSSQEILNKYNPLGMETYNISLTDMYGYHTYPSWRGNYSLFTRVQEQLCNATQINCTKSGMVCNSAKRACNTLPTASALLQPMNSSYPYVENGVPTNLSDLNCTITLTDKDAEDKTLQGDYKVTRRYVDEGGNTQLATLMSGQDSCTKPLDKNGNAISNSCAIQVPIISHNLIKSGDIINCSDPPYDGYDYGKSGSDWDLIKPNVVLSVDEDYLEGKQINAEEYLKPVEFEENGENKSYLVVTEYDTLECSIKSPVPQPLGNVEFVLQGAKKQVQCGSECKAVFEVGEGKDIASLPRGQKIKCTANVLSLGLSFPSNEVAVAQYVYYFVPVNQDSYGNTKVQYDYYINLSQVNDRISLAGKDIYLKKINVLPPSTNWFFESVLQGFPREVKNTVKNSILSGNFDESKDIITGVVDSWTANRICSLDIETPFSPSLLFEGACSGSSILISNVFNDKIVLAHEFGHYIAKYREEYSLEKWRIQALMGSTSNVIGEDGTKHFPKCCLWICCKLLYPSVEYKWTTNTLSCSLNGMKVPEDWCDLSNLPRPLNCGTPESCWGMPYKDKEGNQPSDESYVGPYGSVMGKGGLDDVGKYANLVYPQNSKCPLKNC